MNEALQPIAHDKNPRDRNSPKEFAQSSIDGEIQ
jgi:hypothetical protein